MWINRLFVESKPALCPFSPPAYSYLFEMKEIQTSIRIKAKPERVWEELVDFAAYPEWNPFIRQISGEIYRGGRLKVVIKPPKRTAMKFRPRLVRYEAPYEMRWVGKFIAKGLFRGEHYFLIEDFEDGSLFTHGERFSGFLVQPLDAFLDKTKKHFIQMNEALKKRCESQ